MYMYCCYGVFIFVGRVEPGNQDFNEQLFLWMKDSSDRET